MFLYYQTIQWVALTEENVKSTLFMAGINEALRFLCLSYMFHGSCGAVV